MNSPSQARLQKSRQGHDRALQRGIWGPQGKKDTGHTPNFGVLTQPPLGMSPVQAGAQSINFSLRFYEAKRVREAAWTQGKEKDVRALGTGTRSGHDHPAVG